MVERGITIARLLRMARLLSVLLIARVLVSVLQNLLDYFPPDFSSDFLAGREDYFYNGYHYAFFAHVVTGPLSLIFSMLLMSNRLLRRFPRGHRRLGRIQAVMILFVMAPSGLVMAWWAASGWMASVSLATLALLTAFTVIQGWRYAMQQRFQLHRLWMFRCFLLLSSAVVLRVIGGVLTVLEFEAEWAYPCATWASWLIPLISFEAYRQSKSRRLAWTEVPKRWANLPTRRRTC